MELLRFFHNELHSNSIHTLRRNSWRSHFTLACKQFTFSNLSAPFAISQKLHLQFTANFTFVKQKLNFYPKGKNFTKKERPKAFFSLIPSQAPPRQAPLPNYQAQQFSIPPKVLCRLQTNHASKSYAGAQASFPLAHTRRHQAK